MARTPRALAICSTSAALLLVLLWCFQPVPTGEPLPGLRPEGARSSSAAGGPIAELEAEAPAPARNPQAPQANRVRAPRPGRCIRGTVASTRGAPIEKARVTLARIGSPGADDSTFSEEDGSFVLQYRGPGEYEVVASAPGEGVTAVQALSLPDDPGALEDLTLRIEQSDVLAGVVEDGDGNALAKVELWAFPTRLSSADAQSLFQWRMTPDCRSLCGERSGSTRTDEKGRFRFEGLAPGNYVLARAQDLDPPHPSRWSHTTGELSIRLVCDGDCWLKIRCLGQDGSPASGASAFCAPLLERGPSDFLLEPASARAAGEGEILFQVENCRVYRCGFLDPERGLVEDEVSIPSRGGTCERNFVLPQRRSSGMLVLELLSFSRDADLHPRRVRLRSATSRVLLQTWLQSGSTRTPLPSGRYLLELCEPPARGWEILVRDDPLGEALLEQREFSIEEARDTRIELR